MDESASDGLSSFSTAASSIAKKRASEDGGNESVASSQVRTVLPEIEAQCVYFFKWPLRGAYI